MKLSQIGEFGLIEEFKNILQTKDKNVVIGIGDDTAVIKGYRKNHYLLFTEDALVQNIHFNLKNISWLQIGKKALSVNISDIAAMGGIPKFALISIGLPQKISVSQCKNLYQGIKKTADKYKVSILGGDTVSAKELFISISLLGEVERKNLVTRNKAKEGDILLVSGSLGGTILKKHYSFSPQVDLSRYLVKHFKLSSMIDLSDGLASDAVKIAQKSQVGLILFGDDVPLSSDAKKLAKKTSKAPLCHALFDGEDYELLFTVPPRSVTKLIQQVKEKLKILITPVGKIVNKKEGYQLYSNHKYTKLHPKGFDHFLSNT